MLPREIEMQHVVWSPICRQWLIFVYKHAFVVMLIISGAKKHLAGVSWGTQDIGIWLQ